MFYKFNNIIGRISPGTQAEAYSPQGLNPYSREPGLFIFDQKKTKPAPEPAAAGTRPASMSTTASSAKGNLGVVPTNARYQKIMQIQNMFLQNDGKLVWQKMGGRDRGAYLTTVVLCFLGGAFLTQQLYQMSFPSARKN